MTGKQLVEFSDAFSWDHSDRIPSEVRESDGGFDFPPVAHPDRELCTASVFVLTVMTFLIWGGWKLLSLILTSLASL
jgi:hypothetical protein